MKLVLFTFFLLISVGSEAYNMEEIRELFHESVESEESTEKMFVLLSDVGKNDQPLLVAYKGMAYVMLSKHAFSPINKVKYFNEGRDLLENAISRDQKDIEMRFLRYAVQINVPFFLNYNNDIKKDKQVLFDGIPTMKDLEIRKIVIDFMLKSNGCTMAEKKWLKDQVNKA